MWSVLPVHLNILRPATFITYNYSINLLTSVVMTMEEQGQQETQEPVDKSTEEHPEEEDPAAASLAKKYHALDRAAYKAEMAGRHEIAIACYKNTLKQKIQDYGEESAQTALTLHNLGMAYNKVRKFADVEDCLLRALRVREAVISAGRTDHAAAMDAATTRDALGRFYEERGRFDRARDVRLKGQDADQILCGNPKVSQSSWESTLTVTLC